MKRHLVKQRVLNVMQQLNHIQVYEKALDLKYHQACLQDLHAHIHHQHTTIDGITSLLKAQIENLEINPNFHHYSIHEINTCYTTLENLSHQQTNHQNAQNALYHDIQKLVNRHNNIGEKITHEQKMLDQLLLKKEMKSNLNGSGV